jgi:S1-C subfamily serine protease
MAARFLGFLVACAVAVAGGPVTASDAARPFDSVVMVEASVPADSRTARTLGSERRGGGILIDQGGLVLTIGYLIMEADEVRVTDAAGREVAAEIVAYDHESGFGLVRALGPLNATPARLGSSEGIVAGARAVAAAPGVARPTVVVGRRAFAGSWEYLLENALFTTPPIPNFGGAGLFDAQGRLVGIGSLIVGDARGDGGGLPGNMFIPIDLLPPILADLIAFGRPDTPPTPWLGLYPETTGGALVVSRVSSGSPAESAGIAPGDVILGVGEQPVRALESLWRSVRALGPAGVDVSLKLLSGGTVRDVTVKSRDRRTWLRLERTY